MIAKTYWVLREAAENGRFLQADTDFRTGRTQMWLDTGTGMSPSFDSCEKAQAYRDRFAPSFGVVPVPHTVQS